MTSGGHTREWHPARPPQGGTANKCQYFALTLLLWLFVMRALADDTSSPGFVGQAQIVAGIEIPGLPVVPKPLKDDRPNVVLRIAKTFPRVDSAVYDFECYGLEPGTHDLRDYLQYQDGSPLQDIPEILIEVQSLLPAGQILPEALPNSRPPRLGGYQVLMSAFALLWAAVLGAIIFARRRKMAHDVVENRQPTLSELLASKIDAARDGALPSEDFAELERLIVEHWRRKTDNRAVPYEIARDQLHAHPQAGPLLAELEAWMHRPIADRNVSLAQLVAKHDRALQTVGEPQ